MSEVYRTLPEFPDYEITSEGDVRNRWTKRKINETQNKNTGAWSYSLRRKDKTSTQRNFWGLVYSAWPELAPKKTAKVFVITPVNKGQYRVIPDFPKYEIHPSGRVRYTKTRKARASQTDHVKYVILFNDEGQHRRTINSLLQLVFPAAKDAA